MKKIPYQLVIGDNEVKDGTITYRQYRKKEQVTVSKEEFLNMMVAFNEERK
jgi:threonyl-tRNA synthetase